jgi:integrase
MRRAAAKTGGIFPAATRNGHIEKSSFRKPYIRACERAKIGDFVLYTFRHTCLTRWAAYMNPYTRAYLGAQRFLHNPAVR